MIATISNSKGTNYVIDTESLTCTCPDFRYRRIHYPFDDENRICKHLAKFMDEHPESKPIHLIKAVDSKIPVESPDGKVRYARVIFDSYVSTIRSTLNQFPEVLKFEFCGSYRRKCELVSDLDVLIILKDNSNAEAIFNYFENSLQYVKMWRGPIKAGYTVDGFIRVDFKIIPNESWAYALCHFTGSKLENIRLRRRASDLGYKLNEYGLFDQNNNPIHDKLTDEKDIYGFLQLPYKKPNER